MDAIERAIRSAFEKGNAEERTFREKVYRQAFVALDRAMQAHPNMTVEVAISRRKALQSKIAEIETEFLPAVPARKPHPALKPAADAVDPRRAPAPTAPPVQPTRPAPQTPDVATTGAGSRRSAPSVAPPTASQAAAELPAFDMAAERAEPRLDSGNDGQGFGTVAPERNERRARKRRTSMAVMFTTVTAIVAIGIGGWWAYQTGLFHIPETFTSPPQTVTDADYEPPAAGGTGIPGSADADRNWISVFSPSDPSLVNAPSGTTAEVQQDDTGSFLRVRSGASGAAVVFDVGQGILQQIAGRKAVFDIIARAEEGTETQISVNCDFGELGDCGRKRYAVGYQRGEYLFDVDLPDNDPGASGSIAIASDITNGGAAVDIYEIRVSVAE